MSGGAHWKDGFWSSEKMPSSITVIKGHRSEIKNFICVDYPDIEGGISSTMRFGDFGPARKEIAEATGRENYNVEVTMGEKVKINCVVNEGGTEITSWGFSNSVEVSRWLSPEMLEKIKRDRDCFDSPRCPHITPKPGRPGRIIWLSGAPGSGKSTTCQLMARERGYNYYEADAVLQLTNPFVDVSADNPTMAAFAGKPLKGVPRSVAETCIKFGRVLQSMMNGTCDDFDDQMKPLLKIISKEIVKQRTRLGGDFAVAQAVVSRSSRDLCREHLGRENVTFVVMNLTKSCQRGRLEARHGEAMGGGFADTINSMYGMYEPAGEGEEGAHNVTITEDMTREDVLKRVMAVIESV